MAKWKYDIHRTAESSGSVSKSMGEKEALGQIGRGRENRNVSEVPDFIILDKMFGSGFQLAIRRS